ncbi:ATP-binding response regulator [Pedobacter metabolipauper]|uniref:histidine kinase n=1 Tax=Pedobacter metabolipauper TaxID=425513 RepID=A0A4R6SW79_9SPHI|nr:hybrid sensor histidine kinase/response regulator [Pedobacter metabolipauper]TDQ09636.1 PAS/PAC sensor hybrid histidine kinase [Pedobacter metabolipauper]
MEQIRVLLIDDDEDDYVLTKEIFDQISDRYVLAWVNNYENGIAAVLKKEFDVYLVDYRLGNGTGIDLLNEAINSGCEQPIIMLTGNNDLLIDEQAKNIGAADYLVKDEIDASLLDRSIRYSIKQTSILKALKDSEIKYRTIFEKAKDPILVSDYSGRIHDMNAGGLSFFGYAHSEIINLTDDVLFKNTIDGEKFRNLLEKKGALIDFECELLAKDGTAFYCSLSSVIQIDMIRVSEVYHTIIRDLSYRKDIEEKSVKIGKMSISEHIARGLAEEVRDPLTTINFALDELAADENLLANETVQSYIEIIKNNCDKLNMLMHDFISSTETKTLNLQRHSIVEIIEEAVSEMDDLISGENIRLTMKLEETEQKVLLDKPKIKHAITSVIKNAVEAMTSFPKTILIRGTADRDRYEIGIKDNGCGVSIENRDYIFEPFFTTKKRANGLGLTHAQRVLTTHKGNIEYESLPEGSLFLLHIPLYYEEELWL